MINFSLGVVTGIVQEFQFGLVDFVPELPDFVASGQVDTCREKIIRAEQSYGTTPKKRAGSEVWTTL
ncbi:MAG: hypothetical protein R6U51_07000 [Anaerolineales bacterium]